VPIDPVAPKYATIVNAIQARIEADDYPIGAMLPSEAQLVREFAASRSTVVRALEYLRQQGYIEGVQGKGRLVRSRPVPRASRLPDRVRRFLDAAETPPTTLIGAGRAPASVPVATNLELPVGSPVVVRQRLMPGNDTEPLILGTAYLPAAIAAASVLDATDPLREGLLPHLEHRGQLVAHDVVERLSARRASVREAGLLRVDRNACLPVILLLVRDEAARPLLALDLLAAVPPHGIEEIFRLR
jgi:GntR family transcriptional regulator